MDDFLPMSDSDISKESLKEFKKQGLDIQLGSKVISTKNMKNSIKLSYVKEDNEIEMEFDKLIVAVGRSSNSDELF